MFNGRESSAASAIKIFTARSNIRCDKNDIRARVRGKRRKYCSYRFNKTSALWCMVEMTAFCLRGARRENIPDEISFLPYFMIENTMRKTAATPILPGVFFSRENRFLYLIDGTFSCTHRETHCRHVARLAEKPRVLRWKKQSFTCRFSSRFSIDVIALASERAIEFREINLDVAEIRRGPVEWKMDYVAMFGSCQYFLLLIFNKQGICTPSRHFRRVHFAFQRSEGLSEDRNFTRRFISIM